MTDWEKFKPIPIPEEARERLGGAVHYNTNVPNLESEWLKAGRSLDANQRSPDVDFLEELKIRTKR